MTKKNAKPVKKAGKKIIEAAKPTINELVVGAANEAIENHNFEGIIIVGFRDGAYVPHVLAKGIPDLLTLQYVLNREIDRVISGTFTKE